MSLELIGEELDKAVSLIEANPDTATKPWYYSTIWELGGPIIERELMDVFSPEFPGGSWRVVCRDKVADGPTLLVAAMRAFVLSRS